MLPRSTPDEIAEHRPASSLGDEFEINGDENDGRQNVDGKTEAEIDVGEKPQRVVGAFGVVVFVQSFAVRRVVFDNDDEVVNLASRLLRIAGIDGETIRGDVEVQILEEDEHAFAPELAPKIVSGHGVVVAIGAVFARRKYRLGKDGILGEIAA